MVLRILLLIALQIAANNGFSQNSLVGDGFGGRLWYKPSSLCVGSYSAYSICYADPCNAQSPNQLFAWGQNNLGQLGIGGFGPQTSTGIPTRVLNMTDVAYYSCGYVMGAIKNDKSGWVWGDIRIRSRPISTPIKVLDNCKFLDSGEDGTFFVKYDGTVWCVGENAGGEFGNGQSRSFHDTIPQQMQGITNAVRVASGFKVTGILLSDGTCMTVGTNTCGRLGINNTNDRYVAVAPEPVRNLTNIVDIKAVTGAFAALDNFGDVYTWGDGIYVGHGLNSCQRIPKKVAGLRNIVAISGCNDGDHFLALDERRDCWAWGLNRVAQLGTGDEVDRLAPIKVATNVVDILAGETFSYIVKTDGSVWCSGTSNQGSIWLALKDERRNRFTKLEDTTILSCKLFIPFQSKATPIDSLCDGYVSVKNTGGKSPFSYNAGFGNQKSNIISGLATGNHIITVTDANGCTATADVTVKNTATETLFDPVKPQCEIMSVNPLPPISLNGIKGTWSPPFDSTQSVTYYFTPTIGQCAKKVSLYVEIIPAEIPLFDSIPILCSSNATDPFKNISLNGIEGTWTPAFDNIKSQTYTFTPNQGLCATQIELPVIIESPKIPSFDSIVPFCAGTAGIILSDTSKEGIIGIWSPAFDNTKSATYTFIPDILYCATIANMTVEVIPKVIPEFDPIPPICENTTINPLNPVAKNGIPGKWNLLFDNTQSKSYTFIPDSGLCTENFTVFIKVLKLSKPSFAIPTTICEGDIISPLPTISLNGIKGTWSPTLNNLKTTTYIFTPDLGQCATDDSITINVKPRVSPQFSNISPLCKGEMINPLSNISLNGVIGTWSPAFNNTQTTTYTFTPDPGQCANAAQLNIIIEELKKPNFSLIKTICEGERINPLPSTSLNGIKGTWSPEINNVFTTIYTFTPDQDQCADKDSITIVVNKKSLPLFNPIDSICEGATLSPLPNISNNGIRGTWLPPLDNSKTTIYNFTPDSLFCSHPTNLTVIVRPLKDLSFPPLDPICQGEPIKVIPSISSNGVTGIWSPIFNNKTTTKYTFTVSPNQCVKQQSLELKLIVHPLPTADAGKDTLIYIGSSALLRGSGGEKYSWRPVDYLNCDNCQYPISSPPHSVVYLLQVTDTNGCIDEDEVRIDVKEIPDVYVPNVFSPNDDNINDIFKIISKDQTFRMKHVSIYDRWGEQVYIDHDVAYANGWKGNFRNKPCMPGVYVYVIEAENAAGLKKLLTGDVTLVR